MLVAMMLPVATAPVRHVQARSFPRRRGRATVLFLAGYGAPWVAAGAVLATLANLLPAMPTWPWALLVGGVLLVWQCSPFKQVCLNRTHAEPELAADGAAADADAVQFGLATGSWCVGSCWALMSVPLLFPAAHVGAMVAASLWIWGEQFSRPTTPRWRIRVPARATRLVLRQGSLRARQVVAMADKSHIRD
jgi:predicted metal-binding membrane protein